MSYWIEDGKRKFLGDFANVTGALDMLESADTPADLKRFLAAGRADAETVGRIVEATRQHRSLDYVAKLLRRAKAFPVRLCDGVNDPFVHHEAGHLCPFLRRQNFELFDDVLCTHTPRHASLGITVP